MSEQYATIRDPEFLGHFIGRQVVDVTQHDPEEWAETQQSYFMLMFDDGSAVRVPIGDDGFDLINIDDESESE